MRNLEEQEQTAVFRWARMQEGAHPELALLHHIPNGGARSKATAGRLKAEGVKAGIPDICLPVPKNGYGALYIELKVPENKALGVRKGRVSDYQAAMLKSLSDYGNRAVVCYGAEEAIRAIKEYIGA